MPGVHSESCCKGVCSNHHTPWNRTSQFPSKKPLGLRHLNAQGAGTSLSSTISLCSATLNGSNVLISFWRWRKTLTGKTAKLSLPPLYVSFFLFLSAFAPCLVFDPLWARLHADSTSTPLVWQLGFRLRILGIQQPVKEIPSQKRSSASRWRSLPSRKNQS